VLVAVCPSVGEKSGSCAGGMSSTAVTVAASQEEAVEKMELSPHPAP